MAQLLIVVALDLTKVTYCQIISVSIIVFILISLIRLSCLDFVGSGRAILLALLLIIPNIIFLLFPPSFSRKLGVVRAERSC